MKKQDLIIGVILGLLALLAIGAFAIDSPLYDGIVTILVIVVLSVAVLKMALIPIWMRLFHVFPSRTYTIKKGKNFSGWRFKPFFKARPKAVEFVLHDSCCVETKGIQKVFGLGDIDHHKNSFRYGFRWLVDKRCFEIFSYEYFDGKTKFKKIGKALPGKRFVSIIPQEVISRYKFGKFLFPYFEMDGDEELGAPHDMSITLTVKNA